MQRSNISDKLFAPHSVVYNELGAGALSQPEAASNSISSLAAQRAPFVFKHVY